MYSHGLWFPVDQGIRLKVTKGEKTHTEKRENGLHFLQETNVPSPPVPGTIALCRLFHC